VWILLVRIPRAIWEQEFGLAKTYYSSQRRWTQFALTTVQIKTPLWKKVLTCLTWFKESKDINLWFDVLFFRICFHQANIDFIIKWPMLPTITLSFNFRNDDAWFKMSYFAVGSYNNVCSSAAIQSIRFNFKTVHCCLEVHKIGQLP